MFNLKDRMKKNGEVPQSVESRVAEIRALDATSTKKKKDSQEEKYNKLLDYLKDDSPECRIAAAETLVGYPRESAVTYLCQYAQTEQDENVKKAMKETIARIREILRQNR